MAIRRLSLKQGRTAVINTYFCESKRAKQKISLTTSSQIQCKVCCSIFSKCSFTYIPNKKFTMYQISCLICLVGEMKKYTNNANMLWWKKYNECKINTDVLVTEREVPNPGEWGHVLEAKAQGWERAGSLFKALSTNSRVWLKCSYETGVADGRHIMKGLKTMPTRITGKQESGRTRSVF